MNLSFAGVRWGRVLGSAVGVIALSFAVLMIVTSGYACVLAFQARGAPDQREIGRFAGEISPRLMPWLECLLALLLAFRLGRKGGAGSTIQGLLIGFVAGVLSLALPLIFRGHLGLTSLMFAGGIAAAGFIGGLGGKKWPAGT